MGIDVNRNLQHEMHKLLERMQFLTMRVENVVWDTAESTNPFGTVENFYVFYVQDLSAAAVRLIFLAYGGFLDHDALARWIRLVPITGPGTEGASEDLQVNLLYQAYASQFSIDAEFGSDADAFGFFNRWPVFFYHLLAALSAGRAQGLQIGRAHV